MKNHLDEREIYRKYKEQIEEKLKYDPFAKFLGIELIEVGAGSASAEVVINENLLNAHGTTHGAVIFALADVVFAVASNSYGKTSVALSMNIGFLAPALIGAKLRATARETNRNHRTSWYRIEVENDGKIVAILDALAYRKSSYIIPVEEIQE